MGALKGRKMMRMRRRGMTDVFQLLGPLFEAGQ